ncbi:MAG: hypothetical protein K9N07_02310 [Candidatus Cloacimonetes bacterium]|nr:hypothetical protein [Candidatus Cloacimonadota bacterium]
MKIFIGNLSNSLDQQDIKERLEKYGQVESVKIDEQIAFAEMPYPTEAEKAILHLDKSELDGLVISVHQARHGLSDRRKSKRLGGRRSDDPQKHLSEILTKDEIIK